MRFELDIPQTPNHIPNARHLEHTNRTPEPRTLTQALDGQQRTAYRYRNRHYTLNPSELGTLKEIATFRAIPTQDLAEYRYQGSLKLLSSDMRTLITQALVKPETFYERDRTQPEKSQVFTITREAAALLNKHFPSQRAYSHVSKKRELMHDSLLYRMYQKEAAKITAKGGTNLHPVLDYDLKKEINRQLARARNLPRAEQQRIRQAAAEQHGLKLVDNKIALPDLRIEYEDRNGDRAQIDLELVTEHYKSRHIAQKANAGFSLYSSGDGKARSLNPDITTEIFAL